MKISLTDHQRESIRNICRRGGRVILCRKPGDVDKDGKDISKHPDVPAMGGPGYFKRPPISPERVIKHLESGRNIGIEPCSIGYCVVDCDGVDHEEDPHAIQKNKALASEVVALLGTSLVLDTFPSVRFDVKGSQHVYGRRDLPPEPDSKTLNRTDNLIDGDPEKKYDYRCYHTYVVITPYYPQLSDRLNTVDWDSPERPAWDVLEDAAAPEDAKQEHSSKADREPDESDSATDPRDESLRPIFDRFIKSKKIEMPEEGKGHFNVARQLGWKAGTVFHKNQLFHEQAQDWLKSKKLKHERWDTYHDAFERGKKDPEKRARKQVRVPEADKVHLVHSTPIRRCREAFEHFGWTFRFDLTRDAVEAVGWKPANLPPERLNKTRYRDSNSITLIGKSHIKIMWTEINDRCVCIRRERDEDGEWIEKEVQFKPSMTLIDNVMEHISQERCFDPIEEFIQSIPDYDLKWGDIAWALFEKLGVKRTPLNLWGSRQLLMPAYYYNSREPEKYQTVRPLVILAGDQDLGKTALLRELFPPEYQVYLHGPLFDPTASDQKRVEAVHGRMLVEIGEMQRHSAKTLDAFKAFSQQKWDSNVRLVYRRNPGRIKRTAAFVGTANKMDCLPSDDTIGQANTRFLPVHCTTGFNVEQWMAEEVAPGVPRRMALWAQIKFECEELIREKGGIRMPKHLKEEFHKRLDRNAYVTDALRMAVQWLTIDIDSKYPDAKDRKFSTAELMHMKIYIDKHMGGKADFTRARALEMEFASGMKATGLWKYKRGRRPWRRTNKEVSTEAHAAKINFEQQQQLDEQARRGGYHPNEYVQ